MDRLLLCWFLLGATLQRSSEDVSSPGPVLDSCEGDVLLLLDSSGSVSNYEFSRLSLFAAKLLHPFSLGRGHIRVGLLQVSTNPTLEFGLDVHNNQQTLQKALRRVSQLKGDTNTKAALQVAQQLLAETQENVPKVLLWLTDGVQPGDVDKPMTELKAKGVFVLAVSTVHGNYQVLKHAVTPPLESHLFCVDIDSIEIITEELREAIIRIICAWRLYVVQVTTHSAVLQWHPLLGKHTSHYQLQYKSVRETDPETRRVLPGDSSWVELTNLRPDTTYTVSLQPVSNQRLFDTLHVNFTTLTDVSGPAIVSMSDRHPHQMRVSWGPLQPSHVHRYIVEYGAIPSGHVHTLVFDNQQNSTLLTNLEPGSQYLVTVSAHYFNGRQTAMSVRACTEEPLPALTDLQVTTGQHQEVQVTWQAHHEGLRGYWVSWEREKSLSSSTKPSSSSTSIYLPPESRSTQLMVLAARSRVCVSPIYIAGRGDRICCTAETDKAV
ncbi:von Willebrand factor A domain-containing protein 1-like isoform X2 [Antennarius striatus]|uniref:von Willebrand factor A domain-containing protein 1-like isoform X2 n=1 Tax=Antennarius striatus TaxID=241820 RepID=UPI0035B27440